MYSNNEEFLTMLATDYPGIDWDGLPLLDETPDVYIVNAMSHRRLNFINDARDIRDQIGIGFREFTNRAEADALASELIDPNGMWQTERMTRDDSCNGPIPSIEYMGPVIPSSITVVKCKTSRAVDLDIMRDLRKQALEHPDQNQFPIYLP